MLTTKEMKQILAEKLKAENTYFTIKDIHMTKQARKHNDSYKVFIADYEHIIFTIEFITDEDNKKEIALWKQYKASKRKTLMLLEEKHNEEAIKNVLLYLGYYIGSRF